MNSEKSQGTKPFKVLIIGEPSLRIQRMLGMLREQHGDRLEVIEKDKDGELDGCGMSFIAMDEYTKLPPIPTICPEIVVENSFKLRGREYWQKGRWG